MRALFGAAMLLVPIGLAAHPHTRVEQQAHLSLGRTRAVVTHTLMPSPKDGPHILAHIDINRDGRIDSLEKRKFTQVLISRSRLILDGKQLALAPTHVSFPEGAALSAGQELIQVKAAATFRLSSERRNRLLFAVSDHRFAKGWFIQPFYFADLLQGRVQPTVQRNPSANMVRILI